MSSAINAILPKATVGYPMKYQSNFLALLFVLVALSAIPAMAASVPRSTPGLDPSALACLATAGYMGYKSLKARF